LIAGPWDTGGLTTRPSALQAAHEGGRSGGLTAALTAPLGVFYRYLKSQALQAAEEGRAIVPKEILQKIVRNDLRRGGLAALVVSGFAGALGSIGGSLAGLAAAYITEDNEKVIVNAQKAGLITGAGMSFGMRNALYALVGSFFAMSEKKYFTEKNSFTKNNE